MAYPTLTQFQLKIVDNISGAPDPMSFTSTQQYPLGTKVRAQDFGTLAYGQCTLIYLKGVASTAAGSLVTFDQRGTTTLATSGIIGNLAVALSACIANKFGWYVVEGVCPVASASLGTSPPTKLDTGAGAVAARTNAAKGISGMYAVVDQDTPTSGFTACSLVWPTAPGLTSP